jgi:hypothetical protein
MGHTVGAQQGIVKIGTDDATDLGEGVGAYMGDVVGCRAVCSAGAKIDGDAVERMEI